MPDKETLALINAILNSVSFVLLLWAWIQIKNDHVHRHRAGMLSALFVSAAFLTTYLTSYFVYGDRSTDGMGIPGWLRVSYLIFLMIHVVAAVAMLPLIGLALYYAFKRQFQTHMKFSRPALWIWMYVSVTGVMVYLLLYQLFPAIAATSEI